MFYWFYVYDLTAQHVRPQSITKSQINILFLFKFYNRKCVLFSYFILQIMDLFQYYIRFIIYKQV